MRTTNQSKCVIRHKASECIGCCLCAETIPSYFEMNEDGLAVLKGGVDERGFFRSDALAMDREDIQIAVDGCPVDIIRLSKS
ncbi:MAG: ferredoxin [Planctomycetota bacterium]|jgi:ferredoxin|nr:ferredoxin [Planctomycetota bacterium]MDP6941448.1 ferredoxin [Planctomycetota bacterium]